MLGAVQLGVVDAEHDPLDAELLEELQILVAGIVRTLRGELYAGHIGVEAGHGAQGVGSVGHDNLSWDKGC